MTTYAKFVLACLLANLLAWPVFDLSVEEEMIMLIFSFGLPAVLAYLKDYESEDVFRRERLQKMLLDSIPERPSQRTQLEFHNKLNRLDSAPKFPKIKQFYAWQFPVDREVEQKDCQASL